MRFIVYLLLVVFVIAGDLAFGCECRAPKPACAYLQHASAVFVGKVVYTNEDKSWSSEQRTLVRFEVEEILRGLSPNTRDVWIDPGSGSDCYMSYPLGERFLVFASGGTPYLPHFFTDRYLVKGQLRRKPVPPGIDPANSPNIYSAPSCSGSHAMIPESFVLPPEVEYLKHEIEYLRQLNWERASPMVQGQVYWHEKPKSPITVTLSGMGRVLSTEPNARGYFAFENLPSGTYSVVPSLGGHRAIPPRETVSISPGTCGYAQFTMAPDRE